MNDTVSPLWRQDTPAIDDDGPVGRSQGCHVVIVGAGITGLTAAYELQRAGLDTMVIERDAVGGGVTGRTSAHLSKLPDAGLFHVAEQLGSDAARTVATGISTAIDDIEARIRTHGIECDFQRVDGWLIAEPDQDLQAVSREQAAARDAGVPGVEHAECPLPYPVKRCFSVPGMARFHPLRYLAGLARAYREAGGKLHTRTRYLGASGRKQRSVAVSGGYTLTADHVILATHSPVGVHPQQSAMKPMRSYVLALELEQEPPEGLFFDVAEPYHYLRRHTTSEGTVFLVGGADHWCGKGDPGQAYADLEKWARDRFAVRRVAHSWSSQVYEPADSLPFIGRTLLSRRTWIATGFSGDGLTFGSWAGKLLCELLHEHEPPEADLLRANRLRLRSAAKNLVVEGAEVTRNMVVDRLAHPDHGKLADVTPGEARVIHVGLEPTAAYRDDAGVLHACAATCPHMKGVLRWNAAERSWDCPCHGSRFSPDGAVLEGPALNDARRVDVSG